MKLAACILCLALLCAAAYADLAGIAGAYHEHGATSAALAVRVPFDADGNVSQFLVAEGTQKIKSGNVLQGTLGLAMVGAGHLVRHGGLYAIAPVATYDGGNATLDLDRVDLRLGLGLQFGGAEGRIHIAAAWEAKFDGAAPDGLFVGYVVAR